MDPGHARQPPAVGGVYHYCAGAGSKSHQTVSQPLWVGLASLGILQPSNLEAKQERNGTVSKVSCVIPVAHVSNTTRKVFTSFLLARIWLQYSQAKVPTHARVVRRSMLTEGPPHFASNMPLNTLLICFSRPIPDFKRRSAVVCSGCPGPVGKERVRRYPQLVCRGAVLFCHVELLLWIVVPLAPLPARTR